MQELIQKHQDAKFSVSTCKVKGVQYTSHEFLATITKPILAASTLREIIAGSQNIGLQLSKLGIFESVDILLDYASNDSVDVIYQVKESSRLYARTGVDFEQESSLLNLSINIRNLFGRGEQLSGFANQSVDSTNSNNLGGMSHSLSFRKPILGDPDESLLINASIQNNNHMGLMSHMEKTSGLNIGYCLVRDLLSYNIRYNSVWRENYGFGDFASQSVRRHAGHSLKSSIEHDILIDTRNDPIFPQSGYYVKLKQECAGLGGDVQFLKNQLSSTLVYSLPLDMTASGSIRAGLIVPISSNIDAGARINDKFHMGGPLSLRGFSQGGVGPRKSGKSS
jgi:outer membrane protein insertion porin family